ncbi:hypothetical protein RhiirA4_486500 [Rhizophagus irregularis]|uniref:Uncharacterized protein n=1 Tax=Rhizophagus irregularis TaxID=588596 RepID=A0A2I1HRH0_9GLOM|nr:hypothetical protein RhiirA4_486500 [Rhizophagus irregularis]
MKGSVLDTGPKTQNGLFFRLSCPGRVRFRWLILDPGRVEFWLLGLLASLDNFGCKSDSNFEEVECPGKETAEALSKKFFKKLFLSFYRTSLERGLRPWIPNMFERKFQTTNRNGLAFRNPAFGMSRWFCTSEWWMQSRERRMET